MTWNDFGFVAIATLKLPSPLYVSTSFMRSALWAISASICLLLPLYESRAPMAIFAIPRGAIAAARRSSMTPSDIIAIESAPAFVLSFHVHAMPSA